VRGQFGSNLNWSNVVVNQIACANAYSLELVGWDCQNDAIAAAAERAKHGSLACLLSFIAVKYTISDAHAM
jgi:hypothetical protein